MTEMTKEIGEFADEINLAVKKYKDYLNKASYSENKEKVNKFKIKEPSVEELLSKDLMKYPVIRNKEVFDSLYLVYKKIGNYLEESKKSQSSEISMLEYHLNYFKNILLIPNIRYVIREARKYESSRIEISDLISEGAIGLIEAFERYNPKKGFFTTYISSWIKSRIKRAIEKKSRIIKVPIHKQREIRNIKRGKENLEATLYRKPTIEELSDFTNISAQRILEIENYDKNIISLDSKCNKLDSLSDFYNYIKDERYIFEEKLANCDLIKKLLEGVKMTERERKILWDNIAIGKTLKEIGRDYNLTKERIRQIRDKVIRKIIIHNEKINTLEKLGIKLR